MRDLNDFQLFHSVVTHRGFSAAERATGIPKGTLSKAVARLEERLGVRLLERTTRKLAPTEVGKAFYEHVEVMLGGAEAAEASAAEAQAEPSGLVRVSCPQGLIQNLFGEILPRFMLAYPRIRLQLKVINRRADFVDDAIDIALRARSGRDEDSSMVVRSLGSSRLVLAASPLLISAVGGIEAVDRLADVRTLTMNDTSEDDRWQLVGPEDRLQIVLHRPRMVCSNTDMLSSAAAQGLGVALVPEHVTRPFFADGSLVRVLPEWCSPVGVVQAAFPTRKGLLPAVRALIDYLVKEVPALSSPEVDSDYRLKILNG